MKKLLFPLFLFYLTLNFAFCQWETIYGIAGTFGQPVSLAMNGENIFISADNSLYTSSDLGITWNKKLTSKEPLTKVAIYGKNVLVCAYKSIFISTDMGDTWISKGLSEYIFTIAINEDNIWVGTDKGIYLSTDMGDTWISKGLSEYIFTIAINEDNIWVGTWEGIYLSTDMGDSWIKKEIKDIYFYDQPKLAIIGKNILVGTYYDDDIYISSDMGETWLNIPLPGRKDIPWGRYTVLGTIAIKEENILIGTNEGLFLSSDLGITWIKKINGIEGMYNLKTNCYPSFITDIVISNDNIIAATETGDVFLSTDNGNYWEIINSQIKYRIMKSLMIDSNSIFIGCSSKYAFPDEYGKDNSGGIFFSSDNGKSWKNKGFLGKSVNTILKVSNNILIGTGDGIYLSTDMGDTWISKGLSEDIYTIAINKDNIWVGTDKGIYLSTDMGDTWISKGLSEYIFTIAINEDNIWVGTDKGIYLSTDMGDTWISKGLSEYIFTIAINEDNIWVGTDKGIYLSTDMGDTWISKGLSEDIYTIAINKDNIWVGTYKGIYLSTDMGDTWISKGLSEYIFTIAINEDNIYAGGHWTGLYHCKISNLFPHNLSIASGNNQVGKVNTELVNPFRILVKDFKNRPIQNKLVKFEIISTPENSIGYLLSPSESYTDSNGYAECRLKFGNKIGLYQITAKIDTTEQSSIVFNSFATADDPKIIKKLSGDNQSGVINQSLKDKFRICVLDSFDNPTQNINVTFELLSSPDCSYGQTLVNKKITTDTDGIAECQFILGNKIGHYSIKVFLDDYDSIFTIFNVISNPGSPKFLSIVSGNNQVGFINEILNQPFVILISDEGVNPVKDVKITFKIVSAPDNSIGHKLSVTEAFTDDNGMAETYLTIGNKEGEYITSAVSNSFNLTPIYFKTYSLINSILDNNLKMNFSISPNPAGEYIEISGLNKGLQPLVSEQEIKIFNLLGKCVLSVAQTFPSVDSGQTGMSDLLRVDVSGLPAGVYFVHVGDWVGRFLKI